jgi:hypothetical protein
VRYRLLYFAKILLYKHTVVLIKAAREFIINLYQSVPNPITRCLST